MAVQLASGPFDPGQLLNAFCRGGDDTGAVVSFTGLVRSDGDVQALELEAYPGLTDVEIERMAEAARTRFGLTDVLVVHRTGLICVGEPVVFVATGAPHRRSAFEAADQLMDYLKSRAPFWKKSHEASGARWIEPTAQDVDDAHRWDTLPSCVARQAGS